MEEDTTAEHRDQSLLGASGELGIIRQGTRRALKDFRQGSGMA